MVEHRQEQHARRDLAVQVSGRDANVDAFSQSGKASNVSKGGALLSGLSWGAHQATWFGFDTRTGRLVTELCG
jgi:hypothetical protein